MLIPGDERGGWMWMGAAPATVSLGDGRQERQTVFSYKHGITRHYLHVTAELRTCRRLTDGYELVDRNTAIAAAYEGLETPGASRSTTYDDNYIADRNSRLIAAGFPVIS